MQKKEPNALQVPKDFRRPTGIHQILASLLAAELLNTVVVLFIGALLLPVTWWTLRWIGQWFHGSLLFDIGMILLLACVAGGLVRQWSMKLSIKDAWNDASGMILFLLVILAILRVLPFGWMDIPNPKIPTYPLEHFPWPVHPSLPGAWITAILLLLTHLLLFRRAHQQREGLAYARAHPGGNKMRLVDQAYGFYERGLARFDPPPVRLTVPPTFLYFEADELPENLERAVYWSNAESLVVSGALLQGADPEEPEILLPLLARQLYDSNSLTLHIERFLQVVRLARQRWYARLLLCFTLLVAHRCTQRWEQLERERVLDRDRFAYWCGEATRLRKLLREQREFLRSKKLPDNAIPPLHERIDHLEGLQKQEQRQIEALKGSLPPGPPTSLHTSSPTGNV